MSTEVEAKSKRDAGDDAGSEYVCPLCKRNYQQNEFWIECDVCNSWYHGECVHIEELDANLIDKFHCLKCEEEHGPSVMKKVTNKHRHNRAESDADRKPVQSGTTEFVDWLRRHEFPSLADASNGRLLSRTRGQGLTLPSLYKKGFTTPILIENKEGLEMEVPPEDTLTIDGVMNRIGAGYVIDVIDVCRQVSVKMPMGDFVRYMAQDKQNRKAVYNCISLEVSKTPLGSIIKAPAIVNRLSWVDRCWPRDSEIKPAVSKYCLMSMENSFTDFHIDFGGTSVWYHVLKGEKLFYFIEPTSKNLKSYEHWMMLKNQSELFFGDMVDECYQITLLPGQTMLIPTGWIHAVLTPSDSIVFGGNFLHSLNISLQLQIREMEMRIKTPDKFQFPFFELTHWYASPSILKMLEDKLAEKIPPKHMVEGVRALVDVLRIWLHKSTTEKNSSSGSISNFAPLGLNCRKIIKDLNKALTKAEKVLDGQPAKKKAFSTIASSSGDNFKQADQPVVRKDTDIYSDDDSVEHLVVDMPRQRVTERAKSYDSNESQSGIIKMKLALCGKGGLPEVTEVTETIFDLQDGSTDLNPISNHPNHQTSSSALKRRPVQSSNHADEKRQKMSAADLEDQEILEMIKNRPDDGEFIYLDVEEGVDDDDSCNFNGRSGTGTRSKPIKKATKVKTQDKARPLKPPVAPKLKKAKKPVKALSKLERIRQAYTRQKPM